MKSLFFLVPFILTFILSSGCKKDKSEAPDYRENYIGTWEMTIINDQVVYTTDMGGSVTNYYSDTIVNSNVEITIDELNENGLIIDFNPNSSNSYKNEVSLEENGAFSKCCNSPFPCVITGAFGSDGEITMEMENWGRCNGASAGGTSQQSVTGIKL